MKNTLKALLFDKDGTLVDFEKTWTPVFFKLSRQAAKGDQAKADAFLREAGYDFEAQKFTGNGLIAAGSAEAFFDLFYPDIDDEERRKKMAEMIDFGITETKNTLTMVDGAEGALRLLKSHGYKLGIATNDSEKGAQSTIEQFGWQGLFDLVLGYDSVENAKPAGDQVLAFARYCACLPNEIAMIGDNGFDMMAARNGGAYAVGVLSGNCDHQQLAPLADVILPSVMDVPEWLGLRSL